MSPVFYMLEKEFLEHKLVTRLPLFLAIFAVVNFMLVMGGGDNLNISYQISGMDEWAGFSNVTGYAGIIGKLNIIVAGIVATITFFSYVPKTLRKERQEGSLMFWRSMPVSDNLAIAVKLIFALVVIPLVASLLLLFSDVIVWVLASWFMPADMLATSSISFASLIMHWFDFLGRMVLVSLALLPVACLLMVLSQITNHPLVTLFIVVVMIKLMTYMVFGSSVVGDWISKIYNLPFKILTSDSPVTVFFSVGTVTLIALLAASIGLFWMCAKLRSSDDFARTLGMNS
jgi:ABC-2 type transport system permease protein